MPVMYLEEGRVYTWGDARKGQLGHRKENLSSQHEPKQGQYKKYHNVVYVCTCHALCV